MGSAVNGTSPDGGKVGDRPDDENADVVVDEVAGERANPDAEDAPEDDAVEDEPFCSDVVRSFLPNKGNVSLMPVQAV